MSTQITRGQKRKSQDDVCDISTGHSTVVPYEIFRNALGLLQFLVSGYLFDQQSFTSLYEESLTFGWKKIFLDEQTRLKKIKANENSVIQCFLLNRLIYQYDQNSNDFNQQVEDLRNEINTRMNYNFPKWTCEDLYDKIELWRDIQCRRRLFYFDYKDEEKKQDLPTFLMLHKAMTNWCRYLINKCQEDKNYWNSRGRNDFIELLKHAFIIVGQPTGPNDIPVTEYKKENPRSSAKSAKLNVRIICLLDLDVLEDNIQLFNTDVTLRSLNQGDNSKEIRQTPIVWEKKQIITADSGSISVHYTEVRELMLKDLYSRRNNTSANSNFCRLIFKTPVRVICNLDNKNTLALNHDIDLTSRPFGISSHSKYFPDIVAKVFLYELDEILRKKKGKMDPDILTEYVYRYQIRMLGVKPKQHTTKYIRELFTKAFDDVRTKVTETPLRLLIEQRLACLISQIKFMVDYPVLAMMYYDSLFLGICNNDEVDEMLTGTLQQPQMLLRFEDLLRHQWNEIPEIRCIINNGILEKTTFSKKAFIDDMCRFIYESAEETAKQTTILSYTDQRIFHNFQWYYNDLIPILSKIVPTRGCVYKPLIPVLWQSRTRSRCNANSDSQSQPSTSSTQASQLSNSNLHNNPLTITCTENQQNLQMNSTDITLNIKILVATNIDPNVIVRYLTEKFQELCKIQDENISPTHSIQSLQTTTCSCDTIDENIDEQIHLPDSESDDDQNGPLLTPILQTDSNNNSLQW